MRPPRPFLEIVAPAGVALAAALLPPILTTPAAGQDVDLGDLEARVEGLRKAWNIPGLALAIVRDDSVVLARGFGVREAGRSDAVDAATLFAIGSTTKAFTSTSLAILVGEGSLGWSDRVIEHEPRFELADPWTTRAITVRDLLAHRSGLPPANLMWLTGQLDADQMIRRLRHLEPAAGFRTELSYQNVLYLVAGRVLAARSGLPWKTFVRRRLLEPLAMERTRTGVAGLEEVSNVARPHAPLEAGIRPVPYRDIDALGPAGSLLSSAADMAKWLRFQLAGGQVGERRVVAEAALLETRRPQIVMQPQGPLAAFYPEARHLSYAMGWVVSEYRGEPLLDHGGGIDGMTSLVALMPEKGLGVAILTNLQMAAPPYWILYPVLDQLLGHEPVDRSPPFRTLSDQMAALVAAEPERVEDAPPSLPLDGYAGDYVSEPLGRARVVLREGGLVFEMGRLSAPLEPWHFDTFRAPWRDRAWRSAAGAGWVTFRLDRHGRVDALELTAMPGEAWTFERGPR